MKLVLLVVVVAAVLVGINMNHKKLGKQYALLATLVVLVAASYGGYTLMGATEEEEESEEENLMPSPANGELEMPNDTVGNAANVVIEGFQGNEVKKLLMEVKKKAKKSSITRQMKVQKNQFQMKSQDLVMNQLKVHSLAQKTETNVSQEMF